MMHFYGPADELVYASLCIRPRDLRAHLVVEVTVKIVYGLLVILCSRMHKAR